jgi:hypothetical protein
MNNFLPPNIIVVEIHKFKKKMSRDQIKGTKKEVRAGGSNSRIKNKKG